jgi:hypothetical protein
LNRIILHVVAIKSGLRILQLPVRGNAVICSFVMCFVVESDVLYILTDIYFLFDFHPCPTGCDVIRDCNGYKDTTIDVVGDVRIHRVRTFSVQQQPLVR